MIRNVVVIALDKTRISALLQDIETLTTGGSRVDLVVTDLAEWDQAEAIPGVTRHRVARGKNMFKDATAQVLKLDGISELVVGDPPAIIVARSVLRHRPGLAVRFEPNPDPQRQVKPSDLAIVTPWYPSPNNAMAGAFVQAAVECLDGKAGTVSILHSEDWSPTPRHRSPVLVPFADRLVAPNRRAVVTDTPAGELVRVPVLVQRQRSYADWAEDHAAALRGVLPTGQIEAPLIHAHTGIFAGVAAMRLARPDARIVITEHATFLKTIFSQPAGRDLYDQALHRADAVICVSSYLRDEIAEQFPWHRPKLHIIPNPVDFTRFIPRKTPPTDLRRWLYVGRFNKLKRVEVLLEAFGVAAAADPDLTLTMVGVGDLGEQLRNRVAGLRLGDRVSFHPQVLSAQVPGFMREHDLLVHLSSHETFGLTAVEAVATETPVLVTRTAGSTETLHDIEDIAGALVAVEDGPAEVAASFVALRARRSALDLPAARKALMSKYDRHAVGERLLRLNDELLTAGERVLVLSLDPAGMAAAREFVEADGRGVDLVVADRTAWQNPVLPARVRVFDLGIPAKKAGSGPKSPWPTVLLATLRVVRGRLGSGHGKPIAEWPRLAQNVTEVIAFDKKGAAIAQQLAKKLPHLHVTQRFE